ncbi:winged helix-turn-helix domain-containing protein [Candidatus Hodarchaeum mangrovi]
METPESFDERVIKALNHDIRRKILLELYEHGLAGYSDLARVLNLKPGVFYHHVRILEDALLIEQDQEKIYQITYRGYQALEFLKTSFVPIETSDGFSWLNHYNLFSSKISSRPLFISILLIGLISMFLIYLNLVKKIGIIGFFIFTVKDPILLIILSFSSIGLEIIIYFLVYQLLVKRSFYKADLLANFLFPPAIIFLIIVIFSLISDLPLFLDFSGILGLLFSLFSQIFSLSYYLHLFHRSGLRTLDRVLILLLIVQYGNLLVLYALT